MDGGYGPHLLDLQKEIAVDTRRDGHEQLLLSLFLRLEWIQFNIKRHIWKPQSLQNRVRTFMSLPFKKIICFIDTGKPADLYLDYNVERGYGWSKFTLFRLFFRHLVSLLALLFQRGFRHVGLLFDDCLHVLHHDGISVPQFLCRHLRSRCDHPDIRPRSSIHAQRCFVCTGAGTSIANERT